MSKVRVFFYAQRKSGFDPPETATDARFATIKGTLWADGEDAYLKLDGQHTVQGETMLVDLSEMKQIDQEEEHYGWHRVQTQTTDGLMCWTYQYRSAPPEDAVISERWPIAKQRTMLEKNRIKASRDPQTGAELPVHEAEKNHEALLIDQANLRKSAIAKPEQAPKLPATDTVAHIEDHKQDLDWKTKDVEILHKASPIKDSAWKLANLIKEHRRLVHVLRTRSHADDAVEAVRQAKELAGYQSQAGVEGEDDSSPLTKAIKPEGNAESVERSSRVRKGNLDLEPRQPHLTKEHGVRPTSGPGKPLAKSMPGQMLQVSTIAVIHGDHILMGRRRDSKKLIMPGGHSDPGENPEQTARRELFEETGINAKEMKYLGCEEALGRDGKMRNISCFVTFGNFHPTSVHDPDDEVEEWMWVPAVQYEASGTSDALHDEIAEQLHVRHNNILLKLLGIGH